jgi:hypothetical protein
MNKEVKIKSNPEKFFIQYLNLLSPITKIGGKEEEVLAELMYQNYVKSHIPEDDRFKLIFSSTMRASMCERLNISGAVFRNAISKLRKSGVIVEDKLHKSFIIELSENMEIKFKFTIDL